MKQPKGSRSTSDKIEDSFRAVVLFVVIGLIAAITEHMSLAPADAMANASSMASNAIAAQPVAASVSEYSPSHFKPLEGEPAAQLATF